MLKIDETNNRYYELYRGDILSALKIIGVDVFCFSVPSCFDRSKQTREYHA